MAVSQSRSFETLVRLKITQRLSGSIDGLHLDRFEVGVIYEVGTALANYLLAVGAAEPVIAEDPHAKATPDQRALDHLQREASIAPDPLSQAAHRPRSRGRSETH